MANLRSLPGSPFRPRWGRQGLARARLKTQFSYHRAYTHEERKRTAGPLRQRPYMAQAGDQRWAQHRRVFGDGGHTQVY